MDLMDLAWLIPALPLLGVVVLVPLGRRLGEPGAGWWATLMAGGSFAASVVVFVGLLSESGGGRSHEVVLFDWIPTGGLDVEAGLLVDQLSITMVLFITGVGSLIHLYAVGYMHGDPKFSKFFLYLNLFLFSMIVLVLGNNLLVTFVGWEGVGACSYLLISFFHTRPDAPSAGKKAFVTNRIGDWGYLVAMFAIFAFLGTLTYDEVLERAGNLSELQATAIALAVLVAAAGKSAQLPLFVWLPDAMAGPTPVSALIHAATMVTSGIYLTARLNPILFLAPGALTVIAWVGAITALVAATAAVAQNDIKRVLAYSTVSQLGYMFLAIGSGAYVAALFHVITHAFFKALLFLGAGSVIHGVADEQDMRRMGGLARLMPVTAVTFIVGWLAIAGVPPFAGFWSKDEILLNAWENNPALWVVGIVTAGLTAFYMTRQVVLVFFGTRRWGDEVHPHESPALMTVPLAVLAVLAAVGGGLNLPLVGDWLVLEHFLEPVFEGTLREIEAGTGLKVTLALVSAAVAVAGIAAGWLVYGARRVDARRLEPALLADAWYIDRTYAEVAAGPGRSFFDGVARFDSGVVDGAVNGVGRLIRGAGDGLRRSQTGYVRNYAIPIATGSLALIAWFLARASL